MTLTEAVAHAQGGMVVCTGVKLDGSPQLTLLSCYPVAIVNERPVASTSVFSTVGVDEAISNGWVAVAR